MFKKINTTTLIIVFAVFGGIVLFNKFYQSKKDESTFRDVFVQIDTASVNTIFIYPSSEKRKEIKISKNGNRWDLQNDRVKTQADNTAVRDLLAQFVEMKSVSLAGQDKSSWKELQVSDTTGTRIKFMTNDNKTYNIIVGKIGYIPSSRNGLTYIRHADEDPVYAVQGYLAFSINQGFNSWRNKTFLKGNVQDWTSLAFTYPADSSFTLSKTNNQWNINGEKADSAQTVSFLNQINNMQSSGFVDSYTPSATPVFALTIHTHSQTAPITIQAYSADSTRKLILHSSLNPDAFFSEKESNLAGRLFVAKQRFIKSKDKTVK